MRSILEFLVHLRSLHVSLSLDGETLKCSAPHGVLTAELQQELASRKQEIVTFLRSSRSPHGNSEPKISLVDRSGPLPLSFGQQRLWFLDQLDPDSAANNIGIALRMQGPLHVPALERALMEIVSRHEDLRTSFVRANGVPQTVIGDGRNWVLQVIDASHLVNRGGEAELRHFVSQLILQPFDLSRGPLFRAHLLAIASDDHILVLTMHHIVSDGWSIGVLVREFSEIYPAFMEDRKHSLPPLAIQYVDFAAWQRAWLESGELDRQLPYWKKQLAGAPPLVVFPPDHRRRGADLFRGRRADLLIPRPLVMALEKLSQRHGVTMFMTLLAAFNVLLARYCGQEDIVVGTPSANRNRAELHPLIGFFVNNLVLRTDLSGNPRFAELLGRVREVTLGAYEHQDVPFDTLVHAMHSERSIEHSPLFQVMFILQNFPLQELDLPGLKTRPVEPEVEHARFDLTVEVFPRHGEFCAYFDYNADLYEPETIARIQQHYLALLQAVCANPDQKIASIPLLSASERQQLIVEWNRTEAEIPAICFHQRVEAHARANPDRLAVMADGSSLTYSELNHRANRIAAALRIRGAVPESLVAVCIARSVDLVAALLGVAKSGAAYVPLDPTYPTGRILHILEDARPLVILTTTDLLPSLPVPEKPSFQVICLDQFDESNVPPSAAMQNAEPSVILHPDNLAYVIFTSGSTGRPKGVQITHRALVNFLEAMCREPGFNSTDVLLAVTTVSFDIAALELLLPLYTGATVCIAVEPGNPVHLLGDFERYRPTVMQGTPATWKLLIAAGWKGDQNLKILCGGEALDTDLARSLLVRSQSLWNMYGPTETTIWSAVLPIEQVASTAIPVGRPMQNTSFYVLDALGEPTPFGVAGELWIGGEGLSRGYLNRPDLTAERFMFKSFPELTHSSPGVRLYRTGDLVRYRRDGTLDFLGRMDHQVKLRGFRIELGEIESLLRIFPGVVDAVTVLQDGDDDKRLVAYLVFSGSADPSVATLRDHLRTTLPEYMIPSAFVFLQELPRLPNGKLDRNALPAPQQGLDAGGADSAVASTSLQEAISAAFRNVLQVEKVGVDQNFFDLGAHSLQIVRVHDELNHRIPTKVPLISFFQYPTIRTLAAFIEQQSADEAYGETGEPLDRQVRAI
ncbi:MAG: amino acid adenylation domain-containing protein [Acidobacteriota bacterium]